MKKFLMITLFLAACSSDSEPQSPDLGGEPDATGTVEIGCDDCTVFVGEFFDGEQFVSGAVSVRGGQIDDVIESAPSVVVGERVDLDGTTLVPGLLDMHVHMAVSGEPYRFFTDRPYWRAKMKAMLRSGVTGLLDLGAPENLIFEMRRRERAGDLLSPKIYAAGAVITAPGGHPCQEGEAPFACRLAADADEAEAHADELVALDADVIKVIVDGGVPGVEDQRLSVEEVRAVVEAAGDTPVVAHIASIEDLEDCLDAGVTRFAHVPTQGALDDELVSRLEEVDAVFIPTLSFAHGLSTIANDEVELAAGIEASVPGPILDSLQDPELLAAMQTVAFKEFAEGIRDDSVTNFEKLAASEVSIVAGSDAGNPNTFFGPGLVRELELYVQHGLSIERALAAATGDAADFLGLDVGRIAVGLRANLVVVRGSVRDNLAALRAVEIVYLDGVQLEPDSLDVRTDEVTVDPVTRRAAFDEVCLVPGECGNDLICEDWLFVCRESCTPLEPPPCSSGICRESRWAEGGYCRLSDECDLFAQDCPNQASCYWVGNGATECFLASEATQSEPCGPANSCAPGLQCSFMTRTCLTVCDPANPDCPENTACFDRSSSAGISVGECR